jgi:hypothetical protein
MVQERDSMEKRTDLGIYSEVPFMQRILTIIDSMVWVLLANPISAALVDIIWGVLIAIFISSKLRSYSDSMIFGIVIIGILFAFFIVWGWMLSLILQKVSRLAFGKPIFGKLGGVPEKQFFTLMKCAQALKLDFKDEDWVRVKEFNNLDNEIIEEILKFKYRENVYNSSASKEPSDFESEWSKIWNDKILKIGTEGFTFKDILSEGNLAFRIMPLKLDATTQIMVPFIKVFQLIMIYFILGFLNGSGELLTIIQIGVFLSFIISIIWFIHHSYRLAEIPFLDPTMGLPENIRLKFSDRSKAFIGLTVRPIRITVKKRYHSLIRDYLGTFIVTGTFLNTVLLLVLTGITLFIGIIWFPTNKDSILLWYKNLIIGILLLPVGFIIGYYLTFLILQNVRKFLAPIVAGLLGAGLPFVLDYLLTGRIELNDAKTAIFAFSAGLSTLLSTAIISQMSKVIEEKE